MLGAAGMGDIGDSYPDTDSRYKDCDSARFVAETRQKLLDAGYRLVNVDIILHAQEPKLGASKQAIRARVAELAGVPADAVNVKAKTGEHVGHIGRAEAIACHVVVLIDRLEKR
jgi:2-C-methyl-D-erythritol 2,4-cyclodiphosphate synthase